MKALSGPPLSSGRVKLMLTPLVATAVFALAGCGGGGSSSTANSVPSTGTSNNGGVPTAPHLAGSSAVTISFAVPGKTKNANARVAVSSLPARLRPQYVSASTQSFTVGVDGGTTPVTTNCTAGICTATLYLLPGAHTLAVRLWDAANGAGNELASNTAAACTVVANTANACPIGVYGFAASLQMVTASANVSGSQLLGFAYVSGAATPFTIVALDADGNAITGSGAIGTTLSAVASGITIATPAPGASPSAAPIFSIADTNTTSQTLAILATPAPHSDGANVSANVTITGAGQYAGQLFFFSGAVFDVVSATTGQTTLSVASPLSGAPFAAATGNEVLLNASGNANLSIFDLTTGTITHTIATGCTSSDNVPIAADGGRFYYDCGNTVYAYDSAGVQQATWPDQEASSTGFIAAGGGFVYTKSGTTVYEFSPSGTQLRTFTIASVPSPQWAFAAGAQGLFVAQATTERLYSPLGTLITSFTAGQPSCDVQPVGSYLTVRTGSTTFKTYNVSNGALISTVTSAATPSDCRVGFSN